MNFLLYDGECPFCTEISRYYELRQALNPLELVSMRDVHRLRSLRLPQDLDFNEGMILILEDTTILQGESALHEINSRLKKTSLRDQFLKMLSYKKWITKIVYPIFLQARKVALWKKGVSSDLKRVDLIDPL